MKHYLIKYNLHDYPVFFCVPTTEIYMDNKIVTDVSIGSYAILKPCLLRNTW